MSKHMTLTERNHICIGLNTGKFIDQIADKIGKDFFTVSCEIKKHAQTVDKGVRYRIKNRCAKRKTVPFFNCVMIILRIVPEGVPPVAIVNMSCPHYMS